MPGESPLQRVLEELRVASRPRLILRPSRIDPSPRSVALVAGSFDPMTVAHAALAEAALERADLAVLVYSIRTLPKEGPASGPLFPEADRIAVLERFCAARTRAVVGLCSHGLLADQVEAVRERFPPARLSLVMGSDKVLQLLDPRWYQDRDAVLGRLFQHADVLYAVRGGEEGLVRDALGDLPDPAWRASFHRLDIPPGLTSISSRLVRERLRRGDDVRALVPEEAHAFLGRGA